MWREFFTIFRVSAAATYCTWCSPINKLELLPRIAGHNNKQTQRGCGGPKCFKYRCCRFLILHRCWTHQHHKICTISTVYLSEAVNDSLGRGQFWKDVPTLKNLHQSVPTLSRWQEWGGVTTCNYRKQQKKNKNLVNVFPVWCRVTMLYHHAVFLFDKTLPPSSCRHTGSFCKKKKENNKTVCLTVTSNTNVFKMLFVCDYTMV